MKATLSTLPKRLYRFLGSPRGSLMLMVLSAAAFLAVDAWSAAPLPWEGPITQIACSMANPIAKAVAVIAIVVAGLMFALGEGGGIFKTILSVVMGVSIALLATTWVSSLGSVGGGGGGSAITCPSA